MQTFPLFPSRRIIDLNGSWEFQFREHTTLEDFHNEDFTADDLMLVPACFDALPAYYCRRGTALYRRTFVLPEAAPRAVLKLGGLGLRARFWLDGTEIAFTNLPYSGGEFILPRPLAAGSHTLTAAIDNNFSPEKMKLFLPFYDFYAFGGFYRDAELQILPETWNLQRVQVRTVDYRCGKVALRFLFQGEVPAEAGCTVQFDTDDAPQTVALKIADGEASAEFSVPGFRLWSPAAPHLHTVCATLAANGDKVVERFGIREIAAAEGKILLNGEPLYLQGFNRHESHPQCGAATSENIMLEDLQNLRKLGCNFVRGCHYPQSQRFLDLCDEFGMLVWEESLGWGNNASQLADGEFCALQEQQTRIMVRNSINHPAVIIWAFLNECDSGHPAGKELCARLITAIKEEDSSRLATFACNHTWNDISTPLCDIVAFNTYPGWCDSNYEADPMGKIVPNLAAIIKYFQEHGLDGKPIIVSEMGTCGIYGERDRAGAQWTEEFQCEYLEALSRAVFARPEISGLVIWQFNDAKSYLRQGENIRCKPFALNLAGVFDQFRRPKPAAALMQKLFTAHGSRDYR